MFEAYSVAIRLRLIDGVTTDLLRLSRHFGKANIEAKALQASLDGIKGRLLAGGLMTGVGLGILGMFKAPLDEAKKFQVEATRFAQFGLGDTVNAQAIKFAKGMNIMGSSYVDNMRLMVEAQGVFRQSGLSGDAALAGAKLAAPVLARIDQANAALNDEGRARMHAQGLDMLRFIEMRGGLQSPTRFNEIANRGYKAIASSGGNVNWSQLRQFMATAGVSGRGMSDTALFGEMEPIIGELKGMRAGTGYMTAYNRMQGLIKLPNQVAHELVKMGIWDPSKITWNSQGGIKQINGNPLRQADLFSQSQFDFYEKVLRPAYDKLGYNQAQRDRENALIGGRTGGAMFSLFDRQAPVIALSVAAQAKTLGVNASYNIANQTAAGKELALRKKWNDLMEITGEVVLPIAVQALQTLLPILSGFSSWAQSNRGAFSGLVYILLGLGAALTVGGVITGLTGLVGAVRLASTIFGGPAVGVMVRLLPMVGTAVEALGIAASVVSLTPFAAIALGIGVIGAALFGFYKIVEALPQHANPGGGRGAAGHPVGKGGGSPYVHNGYRDNTDRQGNVYMDGRLVGKIINGHLVRSMSGPSGGPSRFDMTRNYTPVGVTG